MNGNLTVSMAVELNQYWVVLNLSIQIYFCPKVLGEMYQSRCSFIATGAIDILMAIISLEASDNMIFYALSISVSWLKCH